MGNFTLRGVVSLFMITIIFCSCIHVKPIEVGDMRDVRVVNVSSKGATLELYLPIQNPNNFNFKIKSVDIKVMVNNTLIGTINDVDKVLVKANSKEVHRFVISVEFSNLLSGSLSLFQTFLGRNAILKLDGFIVASAFLVNRKIPVQESQSVNFSK